MTTAKRHSRGQSGFTIIETMIAIAILSVGIVTLVAAFASAVAANQTAEENLIARQKTLEALESVYTARNTGQITFAQIANFPNGIFSAGSTQLLCAGPDGLYGTTDDIACAASGPCAAGPECIVLPGPDGILGTPDDVAMSLSNFTRTITIVNALNPDGTTNNTLKVVTVSMSYTLPGLSIPRTYSVNALVSEFR
jgi:prepilin-type N-terminal cleavage/methylation domain-containing protein